ncbi:unnamed protein product [Adineta steineri]|uniref:Uncharacterized protein n=1 Tax=Adineta steineri TaxID=433720 RepID=A0A818W264_9BILA|nr:unnamed protein product [Adineta steineri]CAF3718810.1 unnamed protein product [Adineta steineri]
MTLVHNDNFQTLINTIKDILTSNGFIVQQNPNEKKDDTPYNIVIIYSYKTVEVKARFRKRSNLFFLISEIKNEADLFTKINSFVDGTIKSEIKPNLIIDNVTSVTTAPNLNYMNDTLFKEILYDLKR